jgi:hypothetical protein
MSAISPTYADLGGGVDAPLPRRRVRESRTIDRSPGRVCDQHMFDPVSGWCGCGLRDDGQCAPGSPAWRAAVERTLPDGAGL